MLEVETLDDRIVPSVYLSNGDIHIEQTNGNDTADVASIPGFYRVWDNDMQILIPRSQVWGGDIYYYGYGGNDSFTNNTYELRTTAFGHDGNDTLNGGGIGDWLYGGEGNDVVNGQDGNDFLYAGMGNDAVNGGSGMDTLYGGDEDDRLYGGDGADFLDGGNGRDGLLGGGGKDTLAGGAGPDRFLQTLRDEDFEPYNPPWWEFWNLPGMKLADQYVDVGAEDVTVRFRDGAAMTATLNGKVTQFAAGNWMDAEVLLVDEALGVMAQRTNNNVLLRRHDGTELTFIRLGAGTNPDGTATSFAGFNSNNGTITLADGSFDSSRNWTHQVVFHEVGHNWDSERPIWTSFLGRSGWRVYVAPSLLYGNTFTRYKTWIINQYTNTAGFTRSNDGKWLFRNGASFARFYGRENPYEDFATSWEAYFMNYAGEPFSGGGGVNAILSKAALIDSYVEALVS